MFAIGDVLVMKLLLSKLVTLAKEQYPQTHPMQTLTDLTKTPVFIKKFKFGKYKGRNIEDICNEDIEYINWFKANMQLDEDMKYTLDKIVGNI